MVVMTSFICLFVSSRKHRYYVGCLKLSELRSRRELRKYLDCIRVKEI